MSGATKYSDSCGEEHKPDSRTAKKSQAKNRNGERKRQFSDEHSRSQRNGNGDNEKYVLRFSRLAYL